MTLFEQSWPETRTGRSPALFQPEPDYDQLKRQFTDSGVAVLGPPALPDDLWSGLYTEARQQLVTASWSLTGCHSQGEIDQDNRRAHLGPIAREYLTSPAIRRLLLTLTGERLDPSWSATCYTYYHGPGQRMGEHCDKADACAFALLTWLQASWPVGRRPGPGLQLMVYQGDNSATGLSARVTTRSNRVAVINGAHQAHCRPALATGESLTMLAGCFRRSR